VSIRKGKEKEHISGEIKNKKNGINILSGKLLSSLTA
jgi:hypothetical protein